MLVEGVSYVRGYRSDFGLEIRGTGLDALNARLEAYARDKLAEAKCHPRDFLKKSSTTNQPLRQDRTAGPWSIAAPASSQPDRRSRHVPHHPRQYRHALQPRAA